MAGVKVFVLYPPPADAQLFERAYVQEHIPMARAKIAGKTKITFNRAIGALDGSAPAFARVVEIQFPSLEALQQSAGDPGSQEAIAHAMRISTGGPPVFLIAEEG